MDTNEQTVASVYHYKCSGCSADLTYSPGTTLLKCEYCGTEKQIQSTTTPIIEESDYTQFLTTSNVATDQTQTVHVIKCSSCGAAVTLKQNTTSDVCIFCGTPLILSNAHTNTVIKPKFLLPFNITNQEAVQSFRKWVIKLWFAPNRLKRQHDISERLNGVYIPYWTYDSATTSDYTGERGIDHTESYYVTINGRRERRTRTVTHWHHVSGSIKNDFDDLLVLASKSLPIKYANKLEPWDLSNLKNYDEQYLSGFRTESYQINLESGFTIAKETMQREIIISIRQAIGGDHQRINSCSTVYNNITFKHILLPIWISAYQYNNKIYRFLINGRTGEVQGERPWSWIKISFASLTAAGLLATLCILFNQLGLF